MNVLSVNEEQSEKVKYFKFLNQFLLTPIKILLMNTLNQLKLNFKNIPCKSSNNGTKVDVLPYKMHLTKLAI